MLFCYSLNRLGQHSLVKDSVIYYNWLRPITGFLVDSVVKNLSAKAGVTVDAGSIPGSGRSSGGENSNPLQYSCLEKSHGRRGLAGYSPWECKESDMAEGAEHAHQDQLKPTPWGWKGCTFPDVIGCLPAASAPDWTAVSRKERGKLFWGQAIEGVCFLCLDVAFLLSHF